MQTALTPEFAGTAEGIEADAILRKCVHCGFCTATCPTYQLLGDELDGPRGRIYLIKQVLEGHAPTRSTQLHLDRCLTCRNCETTCPSGVQYGNLVEIGRRIVDERVARPPGEKMLRTALTKGLTSPLFAPALKAGQLVRGLLPGALKAKVPPAAPAGAHRWPRREHPRKVLLLLGCVQPAMAPNINSATARVLDAAGIQTLVAEEAGCCGAIRLHGGDHDGALDAHAPQHRRLVAAGLERRRRGDRHERLGLRRHGQGIRPLAAPRSGLRRQGEPRRRPDARPVRVVAGLASTPALGQDRALPARPPSGGERRAETLAFHPPCTLQHGQQLRGEVESILRAFGFEVELAMNEAHLCCGSAGTYSVLHPELAMPLRDRKLGHLAALAARDHRLGQHRLHPAPAERHADCRPPLGGGGG